jgi:ABC-type transporter Mla MlaB component
LGGFELSIRLAQIGSAALTLLVEVEGEILMSRDAMRYSNACDKLRHLATRDGTRRIQIAIF